MDNVQHPKHYNSHPSGIECIEIAKHFDYCVGNAIKYLFRNGIKKEEGMSDVDKQIEDLEKAIQFIRFEIDKIKEENMMKAKRYIDTNESEIDYSNVKQRVQG